MIIKYVVFNTCKKSIRFVIYYIYKDIELTKFIILFIIQYLIIIILINNIKNFFCYIQVFILDLNTFQRYIILLIILFNPILNFIYIYKENKYTKLTQIISQYSINKKRLYLTIIYLPFHIIKFIIYLYYYIFEELIPFIRYFKKKELKSIKIFILSIIKYLMIIILINYIITYINMFCFCMEKFYFYILDLNTFQKYSIFLIISYNFILNYIYIYKEDKYDNLKQIILQYLINKIKYDLNIIGFLLNIIYFIISLFFNLLNELTQFLFSYENKPFTFKLSFILFIVKYLIIKTLHSYIKIFNIYILDFIDLYIYKL